MEITESAAMNDVEKMIQTLKKISDMGVRISIDDFGTGYSSLAMLSELPIKYIKLDKSLLDDTGTVKGKEFYQILASLS